MFKVKPLVFTPQIIICYILLAAILVAVLSSGTPAPVEDTSYGTHTLTYKDMRSYQIQILESNGKTERIAIYDYDRLVDVITLSHNCSLEKVIIADNE